MPHDKLLTLELNKINKDYLPPDGVSRITVLSGISLVLEKGDSIAITGPSGSGKSTLLNIIGTLDRPSHGEVVFDGKNLAELTDSERCHLRNRKFGFVFQEPHLFPQCTVIENVLIPTLPYKQNAAENLPPGSKEAHSGAYERAIELLKFVGLEERMNYFPAQLSGGERQRTAVVRALINQPSLLLGDEPSGSLDNKTAAELAALLMRLNREMALTLIIVTHSNDIAALMRRQFELKSGQLIAIR